MDKYRRNDDANDDNEVYRGETYENLTLSNHRHQELRVKGPADEFELVYRKLLARLSPQEKKVLKLVTSGLSIRQTAKRLSLRQQTAQGYWKNIKVKLNQVDE